MESDNLKTIFLLDDEPEVLKCLSEMLQRLDYRVLADTDASSVLAFIDGGARPDLVITDQRMPSMDGLEFVCMLKQRLPDIPVVMMTAYGSMESYLTAETLGVSQYLMKPVRLRDLERAITSALSATPKEGPAQRPFVPGGTRDACQPPALSKKGAGA